MPTLTGPVKSIISNGINIPLVSNAGEPIEVSTSAEMDALLVAANVGKIYLFTGTTDANYTNGQLYRVKESV